MEEKNAADNNLPTNNSSGSAKQINQDESKKNITFQQHTNTNNISNNETENHKDISSSPKENVEKKSEQEPLINSNRTTDINQSDEVTGQDTILKRYHRLSQEKHTKGAKRYFNNVFTIIVIAYTILILLLGFFVYRDISKRLKSLENRISNIETSIIKKSNISFDDLEIYDLD